MGVRGVVCAIVLAGLRPRAQRGRPGRLQPEPRVAGPQPELGSKHDRLRAGERRLRRRSRARRHGFAERQARRAGGAGEGAPRSRRRGMSHTRTSSAPSRSTASRSPAVSIPSWSPQGNRLAYLKGEGLWVTESRQPRGAAPGQRRRLLAVHAGACDDAVLVSEQPRDRLRRPGPEDLRGPGGRHRA